MAVFGPNGTFLLDLLKVLNWTPLSFWGFAGQFKYFVASGRLAVIKLSGL